MLTQSGHSDSQGALAGSNNGPLLIFPTGAGGQGGRGENQRGPGALPAGRRPGLSALLHHERPRQDPPHVPVFSQGDLAPEPLAIAQQRDMPRAALHQGLSVGFISRGKSLRPDPGEQRLALTSLVSLIGSFMTHWLSG